MNLKSILDYGIEKFKKSAIETPVVEAGVIICDVLGCDKGFMYVHGDYEIDDAKKTAIMDMYEKRSLGVPVQYLTGKQEFMSLEFLVSKDVLIPRGDTEVLVESVLNYLKCKFNDREKVDILDIGTGSGSISVSLAYYYEKAHITALDISLGALEIAEKNAVNNNVEKRIKFIKSDIYSGVISERFDVIVSNPPYIPTSDINALMREVREHEPFNALNGGSDGLYFYRNIVGQAPKFLKKGGLLAVEVGINQSIEVKELMRDNFENIAIFKDLSGIDRVVAGELNKQAD